MKAIIIAPMVNANAVLPPMDGDGLHLTYLVDGIRTGGFTLVGNVPQPDTFTCFVLVDTSPETIDAMIASGDYLFAEVVAGAGAEIVALDTPDPPPELPAPAALRIWLIQHGYNPSVVAGTSPNQADEVLAALKVLHQVSEGEYARAWH